MCNTPSTEADSILPTTDEQLAEAWARMGTLMLEVIASIKRNERRQLWTSVAVLATCTLAVAVTSMSAYVVVSSSAAAQAELLVSQETLGDSVSRVLDVQLQSSRVQAKAAQADPAAPGDVVDEAVELQAKAAAAQIEAATTRREVPPAGATRALREARVTKQKRSGRNASSIRRAVRAGAGRGGTVESPE